MCMVEPVKSDITRGPKGPEPLSKQAEGQTYHLNKLDCLKHSYEV